MTSKAYCKSGIEIGHEYVRTVRHVEFKVLKYLVRYVTDVGSPYCSSVVNGRKKTKYGMNGRKTTKYWMKRRKGVKKKRTTTVYDVNAKR